MDIYRLKEDITFAEQIGSTLDVAERLKLELGLVRLASSTQSDQFLFWGRVETLTKPYYIAMSVDYQGHYEFPHKKFFWSQTDSDFVEMPALLNEHRDKLNTINFLPLTGNPNHILENVTPSEENQEEKKEGQEGAVEDSDEQNVKKSDPKNLTELDRLTTIVMAIENECHAVPIGAYRLNEQHETLQNTGFAGLNTETAHQIRNYHLFRSPQTHDKRQLISQADSIFKNDFLDPIEGSKVWAIQSDVSKRDVTLRNLIWPGYISYHRVDTNVYGGIYFGDGIKRVDLPFFL